MSTATRTHRPDRGSAAPAGGDADAPVRLRRVVTVTRPTDHELLMARHGTRGQVEFVLRTRGISLDEVDVRHARHMAARHDVTAAIPLSWRRAHVDRDDLDRFLFEPDDIVVAIGQDGLVPNVAKYLDGQPVIGVNPEPGDVPGRLVPHRVEDVPALLRAVDTGTAKTIPLTMVEAELEDGRTLRALNEIFIGHRTHQSARYALAVGEGREHQSSSGLIVTTGTGASGWASSIHAATACPMDLPKMTRPELLLLVREPWPSPTTGTNLRWARVTEDQPARITSHLDGGGIIFGDGIESDPLPFDHGRTVTIRPSDRHLHLVLPQRPRKKTAPTARTTAPTRRHHRTTRSPRTETA